MERKRDERERRIGKKIEIKQRILLVKTKQTNEKRVYFIPIG